jgi:hypothetical protein
MLIAMDADIFNSPKAFNLHGRSANNYAIKQKKHAPIHESVFQHQEVSVSNTFGLEVGIITHNGFWAISKQA